MTVVYDPRAMAPPPKLDLTKVASGTTSVNTSFTTTSANTSFWSEDQAPQESETPASSFGNIFGLDGANDQPANSGCPQSSHEFGTPFDHYSSSVYDHNAVSAASAASAASRTTNTDYGPSDIDPETPSKPPQIRQVQEGPGHFTPPTKTKQPPTKQSPTQPQGLQSKAPQAEPRGLDVPLRRSPAKQQGENVRVCRIPQHGIACTSFSTGSFPSLSLKLQWECVRLMQARDMNVEELELLWHGTRNFVTLNTLATRVDPSFQSCSEAEYEGCNFHAKMRWTQSKDREWPLFVTELLPPSHENHNAFQRKFGSDRFIFMEVDSLEKPPQQLDLNSQKGPTGHIASRFREMLKLQHSFLGRRWRVFHGQQKKSNKKSFNPDDARSGVMQYIFAALSSEDGSLPRLGLRDIVGWWLPYDSNKQEKARKAYARLDMGASRALPVLALRPEDVKIVPDATATRDPRDKQFEDPEFASRFNANEVYKKATVMTDGCGIAHPWVFRHIERKFACDYPVSAAQIRGFGAKGMIYPMPVGRGRKQPIDLNIRPQGPLIWIRESQLKIISDNSQDPEHYDEAWCTVAALQISQPVKSSLLYMDFLPILVDRGVPVEAIEEIALESAKKETEEFLEALKDRRKLRQWLEGENRSAEDQRREHEIGTLAGFPKARLQRAIRMLDSGFEVTKFEPLAEHVKKAAKSMFDRKKQFFRIRLPSTVMVYGIPDPTGTLAPGEVHYRSSKEFTDPITTMLCQQLEAEALVARSPSAWASDVQRVRFVTKPGLSQYRDVLVVSIRGPRPLGGKLAGGDYDGDLYWICWEQRLVEPFLNAPAPQNEAECSDFGIQVESEELEHFIKSADNEEQFWNFVDMGIANRMRPNLLGAVSKALERVKHIDGLHSNRAIALMQLKDLIMDADKNGRIFNNDAWTAFKRKYDIGNLRPPAHAEFTDPPDDDQTAEINYLEQDPNSIIDKIFFDVIEPTFNAALKKAGTVLANADPYDVDLAAPYENMLRDEASNGIIMEELDTLKFKLGELNQVWNAHMSLYYATKAAGKGEENKVFDTAVLAWRASYDAILPVHHTKNPTTKEWMRQFLNEMTIWDRLKASAMMRLYSKTMRFPIAGVELCHIKTSADPNSRSFTEEAMKDLKTRPPRKRKAEALNDDESDYGDELSFEDMADLDSMGE